MPDVYVPPATRAALAEGHRLLGLTPSRLSNLPNFKSTRIARAKLVLLLRKHGLTWAECGAALSINASTAFRLAKRHGNDPTVIEFLQSTPATPTEAPHAQDRVHHQEVVAPPTDHHPPG